jgi:membrane associated rhomboid family serine protease
MAKLGWARNLAVSILFHLTLESTATFGDDLGQRDIVIGDEGRKTPSASLSSGHDASSLSNRAGYPTASPLLDRKRRLTLQCMYPSRGSLGVSASKYAHALRLRGGFDFSELLESLRRKDSEGRSLADIFWDVVLNKPVVTKMVLILNLAIYVAVTMGNLGQNDKLCCCPYDVVKNPAMNFLRPITSSFVHLSLSHLMSNMMFWSVVGDSLEKRMGPVRFGATLCAAVLLVAVFEISIALFLSAISSIPNFLSYTSFLLSRSGISEAYLYQEIQKQCDLKTCHVGFSGVLFALTVVQVRSPARCPLFVVTCAG